MKLEKAIETLGGMVQGINPIDPLDGKRAMKLGIEALKRLERGRQRKQLVTSGLLPGETEE